MSEAERQRKLLAALWAPSPAEALPLLQQTGERAMHGLRAYRANAAGLADAALAAVFDTVRQMAGEANFRQLAREFWLAHPPQRGDLGAWGDEFPAWLQDHAAFTEWPYLGDCGRLDWALHCCERAADAEVDTESLLLLQQADPQRLRIELMPGTSVLCSCWPIGTIHRAHRARAGEPSEAGFEAVRAALQAQAGEQVLVARSGWRAQVHLVDAPVLAWTRRLLDGENLEHALAHSGEHFDFARWLATALREGWLHAVRMGPEPPGSG